jgi:hypothetical protein
MRIGLPTPSPMASAQLSPTNSSPLPLEPASKGENTTLLIITLVSLATSATTLIGFVSTTVLAWKKEGRENRTGFLDIQLKELEIQKRQQELREDKANSIDDRKRDDERIGKRRRRKKE